MRNFQVSVSCAAAIAALAIGVQSASAAIVTSLIDDFNGGTIDPAKWVQTDRGLEQNAPAGYDNAAVNSGQLVLGGSPNNQYWFGRSLESVNTFSTSTQTTFTVDRFSLTGTGSAWRSSIWLFNDATHFLHFSQIRQENNGWTYNANDAGGTGTLNPAGGGNEIPTLDSLDGDVGEVSMRLGFTPVGAEGSGDGNITISLIKGGVETIGLTHAVTNWGPDFKVIMTGQARSGTGGNTDIVSARFDNVNVTTVPEPTSVAFLGLGAGGLLLRRRRSRA